MKLFLIKGIIFIAPLILLFAFIEHRLSKIPNGYSTKKKYLEERASEYEVLITGTSHALMGINPQYLDCPAYNIAYLGQDLYYDTQLALKYLDRMKSLKLVIVPISYHSLEYRLKNNKINGWRVDFYSRYYGIAGENEHFPWANPSRYSLIALYGLSETQRYARARFNVSLEIKIDRNGWGSGRDNAAKITEAKIKREIQHAHEMMDPGVVNENLQLLDDLFAKLRAKNIAVVLMTLPVSQPYGQSVSPERYQRMQAGIEYLRNKYGIEYFNYFFDQRFATEDFIDGHHLNSSGAEKFTRIIKDDFVQKYVHAGKE